MAQQLGFFVETARTIATTPRGAIIYLPRIFSAEQSAALFNELLETIPWTAETVKMYDKLIDVPRLGASYRDPQPVPPLLQMVRERVQEQLAMSFSAISLNYYRDGFDSVAWHSDKDEDLCADPIVALVSLGATRQMQFRTKALPRTQARCDLEPGSILAMRGDVQAYWEHHIPKVARLTSSRISV
ncbi:MAG: alpha-ketoglutarate-dependent dioxygenase AlkB, partial [Candidatus Eremiobacteraeota bacterium]|nr:alpha-ketoglutarate-dependent dioxygenase AlkB [Candidatus Eremiobacteraeota bacterium]